MGCTQSKDKNKTSLPSRTQSKAEKDELKAKMDMQHRQLLHQQSQEESEEERKIKEDRLLHDIMRKEQSDLSHQVQPLFLARNESWENFEHVIEQNYTNDESSVNTVKTASPARSLHIDNKILAEHKLNLRKQEKLRADAEQKWMIFSSPDLLDASDVPILNVFMDACMNYVPAAKRKILEESFNQLNLIDEDTDRIQVRSKLSDMNLVLNNNNINNNNMNNFNDSNTSQHIDGIRHCESGATDDSTSGGDVIKVSKKYSSSKSLSRLRGLDTLLVAPPPAAIDLIPDVNSGSGSGALKTADALPSSEMAPSSVKEQPDYELPKGYISSSIAAEVVDVYRGGGRLSRDSVHKILRLGYRNLKQLGNTVEMTLSENDRLTIVGDIHGQLPDLLHILEESKLPSRNNKYIFNGDFVDRGPQGIEVVCIMLALFAAWPASVVLNRGNHEDYAICCVYGFQTECIEKYDEITFGMVCEVFQYLPIFTVVNGSVLVLHGGLFHSPDVMLSDLSNIQRHTFTLHDLPEGGETLEPIPKDEQTKVEYYQQLQRDALWSDPIDVVAGISPSPRGAGVNFGPDLAQAFMERNNLKMIVRSHECVSNGFDLPFSGSMRHALCTVFSASNYGGGGNLGAYMVFTNCGVMPHATQVTNTLYYSVHQYDMSAMNASSDLSLHGMMLRKQVELAEAFKAADSSCTGILSRTKWAEVMQRTVGVKINWHLLVTLVVSKEAMTPEGDILYMVFLNTFESNAAKAANSDRVSVDGTGLKEGNEDEINYFLIESLYAQAEKLEEVFNFFDQNQDGSVDEVELRIGCDKLNQNLTGDNKIVDPLQIMTIIDANQTGSIDLNEFFEIYRILEYHNAARFARRRSVSSHLLEATATSESNVSAASPLKSDTNGTAPTLTRSRSIGGNTSLDIKGVNISVD